MAICIALIGRDSSPLFVSVYERELHREFDIHMFLYCSLDIVDEKVDGANRSQELYLGPLIADQKFKSFGYVTNTNVKMVLIAEVGNSTLKDQDVRLIFKRLHNAYYSALSNPFYVPGQVMKSRFLEEVAQEVFVR
uniref:Trafficking protein particle complex subunit 2-like protein n=1 Tax=Parascaris univalens TaxID=6257 RepID=A0A915B8I6_PARUN